MAGWAIKLGGRLVPPMVESEIADLRMPDAGSGWDALGAHPDWVRFGVALTAPLYDSYFRVTSHDIENIPATGPGILAANHSGTLPYDAAMIWADVVRRTRPTRVARVVADHFVPLLPFINTLFSRVGVAGGSRGNIEYLLEEGELILIFPEGTAGVGKPFEHRYQLQSWRVGHVELALRHGAPIIPVAVIGAEEQMPQLGRITAGVRRLGIPYVPISLPMVVPLPVHYHLWYGRPIDFSGRYRPEDADRPEVTMALAEEVKQAVAALIDRGLRARRGVFW